MSLEKALQLIPYLLSFAISIGIGFYCWRRRSVTGAWPYAVVALAQALWSLAMTMEFLSPTLQTKIFWDNVQFALASMWVVGFVLFVLDFTGRRKTVGWPFYALVFTPVLAIPAISFSDPLHHLARANNRLVEGYVFDFFTYDFAPMMIGLFVFYYLIHIYLTGLLFVSYFHSSGPRRMQLALLIAAVSIPAVGTVLTITILSDSLHRDIFPLTSAVASILAALALFRFRLFEIPPVALNTIVEIMHDGVIVLDSTGRVIEHNPSAQRIMGLNQARFPGLTYRDLFSGWPAAVSDLDIQNLHGHYNIEVEVGLNGRARFVHLTFQALKERRRQKRSLLIVLRDMTVRRKMEEGLKKELNARQRVERELRGFNEQLEERVSSRTQELSQLNEELVQELEQRRKVEEALRLSEERYALATKGANDGLWDWDLKNNDMFYSDRWKAMLGYAPEEIGNSAEEWLSRIHPDDVERVRREITSHLAGLSGDFNSTHLVANKNGEYLWALARGLAVRDSNGTPYRMAGSLSDITPHKIATEQLLYNALHDSLTGLPNRALFLDRLGQAIQRAKRNTNYHYAIFYLDFDHFKSVNDSLGHSTGDLLLQAASKRLESCLRSIDTLARLGGDEFVILVEDILDISQAEEVAARVMVELKKPYDLQEHSLFSTASLGIVLGNESYQRPEEVLRDADIAMYQAKLEGRSRSVVFHQQMRDRAVDRLETEIALRGAIERCEFSLEYQPILDLRTQDIFGFEALVRWRHPEKGLIPPASFIPLAEETGLIVPIGKWIFCEASRQLKDWQDRYPHSPQFKVAINLSPKQFSEPGFTAFVMQTLDSLDLEPANVLLEITESVLIDNPEIRSALSLLREQGLKIQIDDFGTGYSSLSYLHQLPIDALKIDKSFISQLGTAALENKSTPGPEIVRTIVNLAQTLGMRVVGEGVETKQQMYLLRKLGCDYIQGYLFYPPMEPFKIEELLENYKS
jgi:diguanylate cyclase (GGDEF)-like protein/PAS domain S-box-containing protein